MSQVLITVNLPKRLIKPKKLSPDGFYQVSGNASLLKYLKEESQGPETGLYSFSKLT